MKKTIAFLIFLLFFGLASPVQAKVVQVQNGTAMVEADEIIDDDLFITGNTVDIQGTVTGDIYAAGGTVSFSGTAKGDIFASGATIHMSGVVGDDAYIAGGNIVLSKTFIGDSLLIGAGSVTIDNESTIGGSLLAGVGQLTSSASIGRSVYAGGGSLTFDNTIQGDARVAGETITFGPKTIVSKDLFYIMEKGEPTLSTGATVSGTTHKITRGVPSEIDTQKAKDYAVKMFSGFRITMKVLGFLAGLTLGLFFLWYIPKTIHNLTNIGTTSTVKSIGIGFLTAIVAIPALLLLAATGIGMKMAGLIVMLLVLFSSVSDLVTGLVLGKACTKQFGWNKASSYGSFMLGYTVLSLLMLVPIAGIFVKLISGFFGVGALIVYHHSVRK